MLGIYIFKVRDTISYNYPGTPRVNNRHKNARNDT